MAVSSRWRALAVSAKLVLRPAREVPGAEAIIGNAVPRAPRPGRRARQGPFGLRGAVLEVDDEVA